MLVTAKMQVYEHSLRIPTLFMGPGIEKNSKLAFLGTQVSDSVCARKFIYGS